MKYLDKCEETLDSNYYIEETAKIALQWAQHYCPEDTGRLYDSLYTKIMYHKFKLGASAPYAIYNELGLGPTPFGEAKYKGQRPFIRPAVLNAIRDFPDIFFKRFPK